MSAPTFAVRLLRAARIDGRVYLAGAVLDLPAADASELVSSRAAVLVDMADLGPMLDALRPAARPSVH